ncbi:hypothetical protein [Streptomyces rimosus]|uniref:hypothetical protein n=1 Tax=Streptomyces rimosus TaxID=1927 RepID=UPI0004C189C8|nr:hypothetical protein [Streptomyces rimosus]
MADIQIRVQCATAPGSDAYDLRLVTSAVYSDLEAAMVRALKGAVELDPDRRVVSAHKQVMTVEEISGV